MAILTLAMPIFLLFSLHPTFVVLPFATLFAFTVAVTASTFKKYLLRCGRFSVRQQEFPLEQLQGHSIAYRIAVEPQQGRKVFTL